MATLSFHAPASTVRKVRAAARKRGIPVSRYLREVSEQAALAGPVSGLGQELEKRAIDSMAMVALARVRVRAQAQGLDRLTPAQITAEIKASRRVRS